MTARRRRGVVAAVVAASALMFPGAAAALAEGTAPPATSAGPARTSDEPVAAQEEPASPDPRAEGAPARRDAGSGGSLAAQPPEASENDPVPDGVDASADPAVPDRVAPHASDDEVDRPGGTSRHTSTEDPGVSPVRPVDDRVDLAPGRTVDVDVRANDAGAGGLRPEVVAIADGLSAEVTGAGRLRVSADADARPGEVVVRYELVRPGVAVADGRPDPPSGTASVVVRLSAPEGGADTRVPSPGAAGGTGSTAPTGTPPTPAPDPAEPLERGTATEPVGPELPEGVAADDPATGGQPTATARDAADQVGDVPWPIAVGHLPLVVVDDVAETPAGEPVVVPVLANDEVPHDAVVAVERPPAHGTADVTSGVVTYTPAARFTGTDQLVYRVSTATRTAAATVHLTVVPPTGEVLVAVDDEVVVDVEEVLDTGVATVVDVLANDRGTDGAAVAVVRNPTGGAATVVGDDVHYVPDAESSALADSFEYVVTSQDGRERDTAVVVVHLARGLSGGLVAVDDTVVAIAGESLRFDPTANDHGGRGWAVAVVDGPCALVPESTELLITPLFAHAGQVLTCSYRFLPILGLVAAGLPPHEDEDQSAAAVTIVVRPVDAVDDTASAVAGGDGVTVDVRANDTGLAAEGVQVRVLPEDAELRGSVTVEEDGTVSYTPPPAGSGAGTDAFGYALWASDPDETDVLLDRATVGVALVDVPDAAARLDAREGDREVGLTWSPPADDGGTPVDAYVLRAWAVDDPPVPVGDPVVLPATATTYVWTGLTNGVTYRFTLAARNAVGEGPEASVLASPWAPATAPRSLRAEPGDEQAHLTWRPPADDGGRGVTGYLVTWTPVDGTGSPGSTTTTPATTSATITGLENGRQYLVSVRAVTSAPGAAATVMLTSHTVPDAPRDLACPPADGPLRCTWAPPSDDGGSPVTGYVVRWEPTSLEDGSGGRRTVGAAVHDVDLPGLVPGETYRIRVAATNAAGTGAAAAVDAIPRLVTLVDDVTVTGAGGRVDVDVTANDTGVDPDLDVDVLAPATGTAQVAGRAVRVTPDGAAGPVEVTYRVLDRGVEIERARLRVHVVDAVGDGATSRRGAPVGVLVHANDRVNGVVGAALPPGVTRVLDGAPTDGTVTHVPPRFVFRPTSAGGGTFRYALRLAGVTLDRATVRVDLSGPTLRDDTATVEVGGRVTVDVRRNDADAVGLRVEVVPPGPGAGQAEVVGWRSIAYTSTTATPGVDTVRYRLRDDRFGYGTATLRVTVVPRPDGGDGSDGEEADPDPPVVDPPVVTEPPPAPVPRAVDDVAETRAGVAVLVPVLGNDEAAPGAPFDPTSVTVVDAPGSGTARVRADGVIMYTPDDAAQDVVDHWGYAVRDATGREVLASVTVHVGPVSEDVETVPAPGDAVTLRGTGCRPGEDVRVAVGDGPDEVVEQADADGAFTIDVTAPDEVGRHRVVASCGIAVFATDLDVVLTTSSSAAAAPAGAGVVVAGLLAFYLLSGSLLAPRGTSSSSRPVDGGL